MFRQSISHPAITSGLLLALFGSGLGVLDKMEIIGNIMVFGSLAGMVIYFSLWFYHRPQLEFRVYPLDHDCRISVSDPSEYGVTGFYNPKHIKHLYRIKVKNNGLRDAKDVSVLIGKMKKPLFVSGTSNQRKCDIMGGQSEYFDLLLGPLPYCLSGSTKIHHEARLLHQYFGTPLPFDGVDISVTATGASPRNMKFFASLDKHSQTIIFSFY